MSESNKALVGWWEWVSLPELGLPAVRAKVDTGARTSALHATDIQQFIRDEQPWVRFRVYPEHTDDGESIEIEAPIKDVRHVSNSSGDKTDRVFIQTPIQLGALTVEAEISLIERSRMKFPMLLGRSALRAGSLLVDARQHMLMGR